MRLQIPISPITRDFARKRFLPYQWLWSLSIRLKLNLSIKLKLNHDFSIYLYGPSIDCHNSYSFQTKLNPVSLLKEFIENRRWIISRVRHGLIFYICVCETFKGYKLQTVHSVKERTYWGLYGRNSFFPT